MSLSLSVVVIVVVVVVAVAVAVAIVVVVAVGVGVVVVVVVVVVVAVVVVVVVVAVVVAVVAVVAVFLVVDGGALPLVWLGSADIHNVIILVGVRVRLSLTLKCCFLTVSPCESLGSARPEVAAIEPNFSCLPIPS